MLFTCAMMGAFQTRGKRRHKISLTNQVRNAGGWCSFGKEKQHRSHQS